MIEDEKTKIRTGLSKVTKHSLKSGLFRKTILVKII